MDGWVYFVDLIFVDLIFGPSNYLVFVVKIVKVVIVVKRLGAFLMDLALYKCLLLLLLLLKKQLKIKDLFN